MYCSFKKNEVYLFLIRILIVFTFCWTLSETQTTKISDTYVLSLLWQMHSDGLYITSCTLYCTHSISTVTADFFQSTSTVQSHVHSHCVITHTKDSPQSASTTSRPTATSFLSFSIHFSPLLFKTTFSANMMEYVIEYYNIRCDTPAMHTNH